MPNAAEPPRKARSRRTTKNTSKKKTRGNFAQAEQTFVDGGTARGRYLALLTESISSARENLQNLLAHNYKGSVNCALVE